MQPRWEFPEQIVWKPTPEIARTCRLAQFMLRHSIGSFEELLRRSTDDIEWFWEAVLRDLDIRFFTPYTKILDLSRGDAWARWCSGGQMNIVHNCLDKWIGTPKEHKTAVLWEGEEGSR